MSTSFFYIQAERNDKNNSFLKKLEMYADEIKQQIYVLDRPLGDSKYSYGYSGGVVLLIPNYKIIFMDFDDDAGEFEGFVEDFIEDLGSISDKYRYKNVIGRPRFWREELIATVSYSDIDDGDVGFFLGEYLIPGGENKKKCELLISLLTGSINDIEKVKGGIPDNLLDKVKRKILLFDGDQTRFVYQRSDKRRITIQGLSGTGKTELLLHKLKEIYVESKDSKVIFTCHNKILADSLRGRIPDFFNFMKVEEQIKWNERLWCVNAWGGQADRNSGAYSYICSFYGIPFHRYNTSNNFDIVCKRALQDLESVDVGAIGFAFDYMLVDESQDFTKNFFDLCEKVTKNTVYVAGDIFQSIFDSNIVSEIQPDFLLSKCYRTDPKTLMFAHALGMGLFEFPKLRWLEDREWKACGYLVDKEEGSLNYSLSREPLRRFEDLENEGYTSIELVKTSQQLNEDAETKIIEIIRTIRAENPTVLADDIGIIFIDSGKNTYMSADKLELSIPREFGWAVNKAYESKEKIRDTLFVSNKNNVKGLEFPFVICVTKRINDQRNYRNALYMMITRSFLRTYLLISEDSNVELAVQLEHGLKVINDTGRLEVIAPTAIECEQIKTTITFNDENVSLYDFSNTIFDELDVIPLFRAPLLDIVKKAVGDELDYGLIREVIEFNYAVMNRVQQ